MGVPWQSALGAVFVSGVVFLLLTVVGLRQMIVNALPSELYAAIAVGIGLFAASVVGAIPPFATAPALIGRLPDGFPCRRDRLVRSDRRPPRFPDNCRHPADVQHRQRLAF